MALDKKDIENRMNGAIESLRTDFGGLRAGRASTSLLDSVNVEVYGSKMPLNQVGSVAVPESRLLTVQVWDGGNTAAVEKAIRNSGLGLNPMAEGSLIRIPMPELNEERRAELTKVAGKYAENARIAIRNVRRDGMDQIKAEKDLPEDDAKRQSDDVQKLTDDHIKQVDHLLGDKEKDIMAV
jgi:ribosome recycling factor